MRIIGNGVVVSGVHYVSEFLEKIEYKLHSIVSLDNLMKAKRVTRWPRKALWKATADFPKQDGLQIL